MIAAMGVTLGAFAGNAKCVVAYIDVHSIDIKNRIGLSHYAWNPLCVCKCDPSICCDVQCLDSQRKRGAMTRIVRTCPVGKFPDTAASRRKMPCYAPSGKQMPWRSVSRRKMPCYAPSGKQMPWRSASQLSRLRLKRLVRLVRPDAQDAIFFFPDVFFDG